MQSAPSEMPIRAIEDILKEVHHANQQLRYHDYRQIFALDSAPLDNNIAAQLLAALRAEHISSIRIICFDKGAPIHSVVFARSLRGIQRAELEIRRLGSLQQQVEPVII
jgi:hypothetical protein